jgi:hypothetical protein
MTGRVQISNDAKQVRFLSPEGEVLAHSSMTIDEMKAALSRKDLTSEARYWLGAAVEADAQRERK